MKVLSSQTVQFHVTVENTCHVNSITWTTLLLFLTLQGEFL